MNVHSSKFHEFGVNILGVMNFKADFPILRIEVTTVLLSAQY